MKKIELAIAAAAALALAHGLPAAAEDRPADEARLEKEGRLPESIEALLEAGRSSGASLQASYPTFETCSALS